MIDIAQYLAGDIDEVTGMMKTYITERPIQEGGVDLLGTVKLGADAKRKAVDTDDEDSFLVRFKNGVVGSIEATRNAWGRNELYHRGDPRAPRAASISTTSASTSCRCASPTTPTTDGASRPSTPALPTSTAR